MKTTGPIDWSVLSGPWVSRRTLLQVAAASGATAYASRLFGVSAARRHAGGADDRPAPGVTGAMSRGPRSGRYPQVPNVEEEPCAGSCCR